MGLTYMSDMGLNTLAVPGQCLVLMDRATSGRWPCMRLPRGNAVVRFEVDEARVKRLNAEDSYVEDATPL